MDKYTTFENYSAAEGFAEAMVSDLESDERILVMYKNVGGDDEYIVISGYRFREAKYDGYQMVLSCSL